jgi:hypothetical protein
MRIRFSGFLSIAVGAAKMKLICDWLAPEIPLSEPAVPGCEGMRVRKRSRNYAKPVVVQSPAGQPGPLDLGASNAFGSIVRALSQASSVQHVYSPPLERPALLG